MADSRAGEKPPKETEVETAPSLPGSDWLGAMRGTGRILGNIVSPATAIEDWEPGALDEPGKK